MVAILVVLTIILFVLADIVLQWVRMRRDKATLGVHMRAGNLTDLLVPGLQPGRFGLPGGLFFHQGHTWGNLLFSGQVKIGLDDFVQKLLGHIDGIALPPAGAELKQGQPFAAIRQGGRTARLVAPVDGVVCAVNSEIAKAPGLIKRDPYTRGWLVTVRPTNLTANLLHLSIGERAFSWLQSESARMQELLHVTLGRDKDALIGTTAADGGVVAEGLLEHLDDDTWNEFQSKFLGS